MVADHSTCADTLRSEAARLGLEVTVSTEPPLVAGPHTDEPHTCPHGTTYWIEPTGEQIAHWAEDGTA